MRAAIVARLSRGLDREAETKDSTSSLDHAFDMFRSKGPQPEYLAGGRDARGTNHVHRCIIHTHTERRPVRRRTDSCLLRRGHRSIVPWQFVEIRPRHVTDLISDRSLRSPIVQLVKDARTARISTMEWQTTFISVGRLGEQIRRLFFTWLPLLDDGRLGIMSSPLVQRRMPKSTKNLRACLMCAILLTSDQFANEGCPNCESILRTTGESFLFPPCPTDATKS